MNHLRYAFIMAWNELKPRLYSLLLTVLFAIMLGYVCGGAVAAAIEGRMLAKDLYNTFYTDLLLLAMPATLGALSFSKEYLSWSTLTDDPFLKRLSFYRMWAIPVKVISWSRMIHMLICFTATMTGFMIMFIQTSWPVFSEFVSLWGYITYLLMLVGYALAINGIHPLFEFGTKGITLVIVSAGTIVLLIGVAFLLQHVLGKPVYVAMMELVQHNLFWPAALALIAGFAGVWIFQWSLTKRLLKRDLS
ncbi:hypothetical protein [Paenibacillus pinihumi]|uniref:hypothetical protein n=1 Tax=Paenibacillus pinihumi TaxID=669462 RepID=UPI0012B55570|nr:hypothetical protein [Paenibacillus pinihumi]